jgi:hypothetical protein
VSLAAALTCVAAIYVVAFLLVEGRQFIADVLVWAWGLLLRAVLGLVRRVLRMGAKPVAVVSRKPGRLATVTPIRADVAAPPAQSDNRTSASGEPSVRTYSRTVTPSREKGAATPAARSLEQQKEWLKADLRKEARALNDWTNEATWDFRIGPKPPVTITATVRGVKECK